MRLKAGDICVLLGGVDIKPKWLPYVGAECEVVAVGPWPAGAVVCGGTLLDPNDYVVRIPGYPHPIACLERFLAPRRPPAFERGSWSEIAKSVGWSPAKEPA